MQQGNDARLSGRQKAWFAAAAAVSILIIVAGMVIVRGDTPSPGERYTTDMNMRQVARGLGVTAKGLARDLQLPLDVPKGVPLAQLGISQEALDDTAEHLRSHEPSALKYFCFAAIVLFGLVYLVRLGRPDNSWIRDRRHWYNRLPYNVSLAVAVIIAGFWLGKSPNPMEAVVKVLKAMVGLYPSVSDKLLALLFFLALALVGNKLICGWACPFGALQELIYSLPFLRKVRRHKVPFWLGNAVRVGLFLAVVVVLFGLVGGRKGYVVYHGLNPFNVFDLYFETQIILATVVVSLGLALVTYRPFCHWICPFGLVSWMVERLSLAQVRIDRAKCTKCGACVRACPSKAALGRVQGKPLPADCFSCARCLNTCPEDAIRYGFYRRPRTRKRELPQAAEQRSLLTEREM